LLEPAYIKFCQTKLGNRKQCLKGEKNSRQSEAKTMIVHNKIERVQFAPDLRICQKQNESFPQAIPSPIFCKIKTKKTQIMYSNSSRKRLTNTPKLRELQNEQNVKCKT
jgi:hypothetical protein